MRTTEKTGVTQRDPKSRGHRKNVVIYGRMAKFLSGELTVDDLDDEELARGQFRNEQGTFNGGKPSKIIPREIHQEFIRRLLSRGDEIWREGYNIAIRVHMEICADPNQSPADRLKAAQYIIERVAGKTPDRLLIAAEDPVEALFKQILNDPDGLQEPVPPPKEPAKSEF